MNRILAAILAVAIVLSGAGAGLTLWFLTRNVASPLPQISAFSHGETTRIGPYFHCSAADLTDCVSPQTIGQVPVVADEPVQLSVSEPIGSAVWGLRTVYEDPRNDTEIVMEPGTLAATIPSVDAVRGRLTGVVVQVPIRVMAPEGEVILVRAEWSVRTVWDDAAQ